VTPLKLCHAAAIALMGWYLMLPPIVQGPVTNPKCQQGYRADASLPLSGWTVDTAFDTAKECEATRDQAHDEVRHDQTEEHLSREGLSAEQLSSLCAHRVRLEQLAQATCVSTDDPRLKGN
jgi:hypothetical protein